MSEGPPAYCERVGYDHKTRSEQGSPPGYFPQLYTIGDKTTPPFVNSAQLRGHLLLLHAFASLRSQIEGPYVPIPSATPIEYIPEDKGRRWVWFVGLAVERFTLWCESLQPEDSSRPAEEFLPPIDVLMVWHAYMLNPGWYAEDCDRLPILRALSESTHIFSLSLASGIHDLITSDPTETRRDFWTLRSGRLFDPMEDAHKHRTKTVLCPKFKHANEIPYLMENGQGYLQHNFCFQCTQQCYMSDGFGRVSVKKSTLRTRKFVDDLLNDGSGKDSYLAGSIRTPLDRVDLHQGSRIKNLLRRWVHFQPPSETCTKEEWAVSIVERIAYDLNRFREMLCTKMSNSDKALVERILSAYQHDTPFSIELMGAVIRQGTFVRKMHELKWTEQDYFVGEENEKALQHVIARYHGFLALMAVTPTSFHVPTLDIDLAWHTHQLLGNQYNTDCMEFVGRYIDHEDKVSESKLASGFDKTSREWKARYGIPYMHCGCPVQGQTIGERLSRIVNSLSSLQTPTHLKPSERQDLHASTHPSDHNSVAFIGPDHRKTGAFQKRRRKQVHKQVRRNADIDCMFFPTEAVKRSHIYAAGIPFLIPLPYYYISGCASNDGRLDGGSFYTQNVSACQSVVKPAIETSDSNSNGGGCGGGGMTSGTGCGGGGGCGGGCGGGGGGGCGG